MKSLLMAAPFEPTADIAKQLQEHSSVSILNKDVLPAIAAGSDMVKRTREFQA